MAHTIISQEIKSGPQY